MKPQVVGNLPVATTSFIGRRSVLRRVKELFSAARQLTLTGPGGVGKTRLARRLAEETHRAFPDGVWLVEFADLQQGDLVAPSIANILRVRDESVTPVDRLINHLRDKHLLLLLDNCEHLAEPCAVLVGKLLSAAPFVKVVATSRHVLGVEGEQIFPVPPLSHDRVASAVAAGQLESTEASALFEERAVAVDPDFRITDRNRSVIQAICQRLEGLPLAIELAAARVRFFSVEEILDHLDDALDLLIAGEHTRPPRQRTIEATVGWSFSLCSNEEQELWSRLSVFSGSFTRVAVEEVCTGNGLATGAALNALTGLVDKSIVIRSSGTFGRHARFQMLELVRQFGAAHLARHGTEKRICQAHRDFFTRLSQRSATEYLSAGDVGWFNEVRQALPNLRAALEFGISETDQSHAALDMATALRPFWYHEGVLLEGYRWLRKALEVDTSPSQQRARGLGAASFLSVLLEDIESARELLAEFHQLAAVVDVEDAVTEVSLSESLLTALSGDLYGALTKAKAATQLALKAGQPGVAAECLAAASLLAFIERDPRAGQIARQYLDLTQQYRANLLRAPALWLVGLNHWREGDYSSTSQFLREAITLFSQFEQPALIAACFEGLAWSAAHTGEYERAARLLGSARRTWRFSQMRLAQDLTGRVGEAVNGAVREELGETSFTREIQTGESWSLDHAINYALGGGTKRQQPVEDSVPSVLTARELEVAHLVARGLTNREIAAELVIATRTADTHVDHILRKLGFRSRTQIAAWLSKT